jgi:uncharacterized membrane protein
MRRVPREINIFSISALDLFASALGVFIVLTVVLFPYYTKVYENIKSITLCNQRTTAISVAITYYQLPDAIPRSQGWYNINVNTCEKITVDDAASPSVFFYERNSELKHARSSYCLDFSRQQFSFANSDQAHLCTGRMVSVEKMVQMSAVGDVTVNFY